MAYLPETKKILKALVYFSEKDTSNKKPILVLGRNIELEKIHEVLTMLGYQSDKIEAYNTPIEAITGIKESAVLYYKPKTEVVRL